MKLLIPLILALLVSACDFNRVRPSAPQLRLDATPCEPLKPIETDNITFERILIAHVDNSKAYVQCARKHGTLVEVIETYNKGVKNE